LIPIQKLLELLYNNKISYEDIKKDIVHKNISKNPKDINVIIGIRDRKSFLPVCVRYLKRSIKESSLKINITIIEQSNIPEYVDVCKELDVDYIYIPNHIIKKGQSYNRSFCFNVGYLLTTPSTWYLFHDIDILVDNDFFKNISIYLDKNPKWLQTYTQRRVLLLDQESTSLIINNPNIVNLKDIKGYKEATQGSTGGSILVRNDVFLDVGGFDPELFYGYGPEDSFFWSKLEVNNKPINIMYDHFQGGGVFADDPAIEVFHMYHKPMCYSNPDEWIMLKIRESFWNYTYNDKIKIIQEKKRILKQAVTSLKSSISV
jgi:hypothetical protein